MSVIYGPPNEANYGLHIKLGFMPVPYISWASLQKRLDPAAFTIKLIGKIFLGRDSRRNYKYLRWLMLKKPKQTGDAAKREPDTSDDFEVELIHSFDENVDPLWGKPRYSFFLRRDARYLNWRYFENPDKYNVLVAAKGEAYLGYIVTKMAKDKITGVICDFITFDDRMDVFYSLVKQAEAVLKKSGAKLIQLKCIVDSPYYETLASLGYYDPGPEGYQRVVIYGKTEMGKAILENSGKWHFTLGDTDEV
jgi:hypothetical protein